MSLKLNTPNKNSYIVSNQTPYQFPQDGNDTEVVTRVQNQDVYSYEQNYFNGSDFFGNLSVTTMGPAFTTNNGWLGGVLAPNGTIYVSPNADPSVLAINTYTDEVRQIIIPTTIPQRTQFVGGVCLPNGKIYRLGFNILIQDTNNDTFSFISVNYGSLKGGYSGCVLGPNGKIYGVPGSADNVIVINPNDDSYSFITSPDICGNVDRKWYGGALAPNGNIYCFPRRNASSILLINTNNDTATASIPTLQGNFIVPSPNEGVYTGGCLAQNGKIYSAPSNPGPSDSSAGRFFMEIDPSSNTYQYIGKSISSIFPSLPPTRLFYFPSLAQDGWIYCAADGDNLNAIRFNPNTYDIQILSLSPAPLQNRRVGCTLAPNGKIYFHPRQTNPFTSLKTGYPQLQPWMMAPEFNKS